MLFQHYEADPAAIDEYADALVKKSTDVGKVDVDVLEGKAKAAEQVDGELDNLLDEPFQEVGKDSKKISLASAFAAGVLYRWSGAIGTFNGGVDELNAEYESKKDDSFGVPDAPSGPSGGLSPGALEEQHDEDVADAKSALIKDLKERHAKLEGTLDDAADQANADLKEGPTEENVLELFASGDLPESAFPLLTALGIDPDKVEGVLADLRTYLEGRKQDPPTQESMEAWFRMLETIKGMDPESAAVIIGALSEKELKALGSEIGDASRHMKDASDFFNFILGGATEEQVDHLKTLWKDDLRPDGGEDWYEPSGLTFGDSFAVPGKDGGTVIGSAQGSFDDCWMFAKLNAIVGSDPDWPQEHVRENDNGTVSVKFYNDDGSPYWVTVTDELPANGASTEGPNSSNWAAYYEKAMAADDHGRPGSGYDSMTAGTSDGSDVYMTGKESDNVKFTGADMFADPYEAAVEADKNGEGVVASNWSNDGLPWPTGDDKVEQYHVYYVKEIESDGDVVLGNPWGHSDITLSPDQFNVYFEDVSVVKS